jgi:hypothetical protein
MLSKRSVERAVSLAPRLMWQVVGWSGFLGLGQCGHLSDAHATNQLDATHAQAGFGGWPDEAQSQCLEVLYNRCEMETRHALSIGL